eukprot:m.781329 g.781329  ORF g.781329 m.781329 type:complete len:105 (-) comp59145_c0_seq7:9-323(-)
MWCMSAVAVCSAAASVVLAGPGSVVAILSLLPVGFVLLEEAKAIREDKTTGRTRKKTSALGINGRIISHYADASIGQHHYYSSDSSILCLTRAAANTPLASLVI